MLAIYFSNECSTFLFSCLLTKTIQQQQQQQEVLERENCHCRRY